MAAKAPTAQQEYMAKRLELQEESKELLASEQKREDAGDRNDANTTYAMNICFSKELGITQNHLGRVEEIIRTLQLGSQAEDDDSSPGKTDPAGPVLSPKRMDAEFEQVEQQWQQYRETACKAAFHQFQGGTAGPSFGAQCVLKLTRDHMRELDLIYAADLHR
jgi:uncharacterized protein YecT (DUF1311 family)